MSPQEFETLQLRMQIISKDFLIQVLCGHLLYAHTVVSTDAQLHLREAIQAVLRKGEVEYAGIAFPEYPPEESDLRAAEFQEAFASEVRKIETLLGLR